MQVYDCIVSFNKAGGKCLEFTILGEPVAQNRWHIRWRGLTFPIMYDPLAIEKKALNNAIKQALMEIDEPHPMYQQQRIRVDVVLHLCNATSKDLDNMAKFLLDALQGVCYNDDKFIFELCLSKSTSDLPKALVFIKTI